MRPIDADALIEKCGGWYVDECTESGFIGTLENLLATEPTIQPQSTTGQLNDGAQSTARSTDLIDRRAAIDALAKFVPYAICDESTESYVNGLKDAYDLICQLPSAQPEYRMDEWCHDCKEYDQEHRCCPRFNRVIREALKDAQLETKEGHWIPHETPDGGKQYECSRCGVIWEFTDGTPEDNEAYFCPKCGTKMKGERPK